jgi:predicted dehydrogenase
VFVEKPMALRRQDCDRIIHAAHRSDRTVLVGFNLRWHRLVRAARRAIARGLVGPVESIQTTLSGTFREPGTEWTRHRDQGGGVLIEKGVHHFDLWRYIGGTEVEEVCALSRPGDWDDQIAVVSARLANGALATSTLAESPAHSHELTVQGPKGRLSVCCLRFDGLVFSPASRFPGDLRGRLRRIAAAGRQLPYAVANRRSGGELLASYRAQWRHFCACVEDGKPAESTPEDALCALRVAAAAAEAAQRKATVLLAGVGRADDG